MAGSIVVAVRSAVVDGLADVAALADVDVTYAYRPDNPRRYQVFTMRPAAQTPPASLKAGRNNRDENATFQIVVHVEEVGASAEAADTQALVFGAAVEEFLADRKSNELGVTGLQWIRAESWEMNGGQSDQGFISQLIYTVRYQARLT